MSAAELFDLTGQVALVTGASSGLGVRFAEVLAEAGAAVALVARRADRLAAVKDAIEKAGGRAVAIAADVTDRAAMTRAFDAAEQAFGTVTVLVNNAGVVTSGRAVERERRGMAARHRHQSRRGVLRVAGGGAAHARRRQGRRDRQHRLDARARASPRASRPTRCRRPA